MAGMVSFGPGVLLFGRILKAGGNSKASVVVGTACIALLFLVVTVGVAWAMLRLDKRTSAPAGK